MRAATRPALTIPLNSTVRDGEKRRVPTSVMRVLETNTRSPFQIVSSPFRRLTLESATTTPVVEAPTTRPVIASTDGPICDASTTAPESLSQSSDDLPTRDVPRGGATYA